MTTVRVPRMYTDPPSINWGRGVAPEKEWPGRRKDHNDVIAACGDGRDYFRYWHRQDYQSFIWCLYDELAAKRKDADYTKNFSWAQRLICGVYGTGKSIIGVYHGVERMRRGFPYFDNGPGLVGWHLEGNAIFTAMATIPKGSVLLFDEAHTAIPGKLGGAIAVQVCDSLGANIRKNNIQWDIVSAHHEAVHPSIRARCTEVLRPFKVRADGPAKRRGTKSWDDDRNFVLAYDVWEDEPFNNPEVRRHGLDAVHRDYDVTLYGNSLREAFALTDSFRLIDAGTAILANKEAIRDDLRSLRGNSVEPETGEERLMAVVEDMAGLNGLPDMLTAAVLANLAKIPSQHVGHLMGELYGVTIDGRDGYPTDMVLAAHNARNGDAHYRPDIMSVLENQREVSRQEKRRPAEAVVLEYVAAAKLTDYEGKSIKAAHISNKTGFDQGAIGKAIGNLFPDVKNKQRIGYSLDALVKAYEAYEEP